MKRVRGSGRVMMIERTVLLLMAVALCVTPVRADISATGDVAPDPEDFSNTVHIGQTASGSVTIDNGSTLNTYFVYVGEQYKSVRVRGPSMQTCPCTCNQHL